MNDDIKPGDAVRLMPGWREGNGEWVELLVCGVATSQGGRKAVLLGGQWFDWPYTGQAAPVFALDWVSWHAEVAE